MRRPGRPLIDNADRIETQLSPVLRVNAILRAGEEDPLDHPAADNIWPLRQKRTLKAISVGPIARTVLQRSTTFRVAAAFDRSLYLEAHTHLICIVASDLHEGPINVVVTAPDQSSISSVFQTAVGRYWIMHGADLVPLDQPGVRIDLQDPVSWYPTAAQKSKLCPYGLANTLTTLRAALQHHHHSDSFLRLVLDRNRRPSTTVEQAAIITLNTLRDEAPAWLEVGDPRMLQRLQHLIGLGPGLTPAGDDLIAGWLIACSSIGKRSAASALWQDLEPRARSGTSAISLAHLAAAGQGMGAAPLHDLLLALLEGRLDELSTSLNAVAAIGHSSGMDALGGIILLLDAWTTLVVRPASKVDLAMHSPC